MHNLQKLLTEHIIEIPVIQRDYAQGRKNPKVNRIRKDFVGALLKAIENPENSQLHLDFIYGRIESQSTQNVQENNYNHVESILAFAKAYTLQAKVGLSGAIPEVDRKVLDNSKTKLMPLDGQQRLTTLWLLHYVLYHQSALELPKWMHNFTYKTRKSSTSFINGLIENIDMDKDSSYSNCIEKSKWFYKAWLQDPTVKGMMVSLDEIRTQLKEKLSAFPGEERNQELEKWIDHLVKGEGKPAIHFSFLSLSDIDVEDDIYIKMNDRGKQLTDFEIFKNDLLGYLQDLAKRKHDPDLTEREYYEIAQNLDKRWHDLFWKEKGTDSFNIENSFHYFFLYHLLLHRISNKNSDDQFCSKYFSALIGDKRDSNFERFDFKALQKLKLISPASLKYVFENLETLSDAGFLNKAQKVADEISFKKNGVPEFGYDFLKHNLKSDSGNTGYYDRTFNYALTSYLGAYKEDFDIRLFRQWCRVLQNLIYNQAYIQGKDEFETAVKHVNILVANGRNVEKTLLEQGTNLGVFPRQISEEVKKVSLYKDDPGLYQMFRSLENHDYFHGQIGFAIDMATNRVEQGDIFNKEEFASFSSKLSALFDPQFSGNSEWLLQRALMTRGFEFKGKNGNKLEIFSNNPTDLRSKEEGWRWLFKSEHAKNYFQIFNSLLKDLSIEDFENDLKALVKNYKIKDWKYYFIKEPETIRACKKRMIKKNNDDNVRLLINPTASGYHSELRTKFLQHNFSHDPEPFKEIGYHPVKDQQEKPCCYFKGWKRNESYHLDIRYDNGNYQVRFLNVDESSQHRIEQQIADVLKHLNFEADNDEGFILNVNKTEGQDTDEALDSKLIEILGVLKKTKLKSYEYLEEA
ncbi:DUF262 domain-containing protein [Salegentibacter sp. F188]|uniref:DUF262 domain-containing protein n=1 Tax=Autumnicola patrickiae TaxID=3075591 RepID=A0ABU3DYK4_9FLAO|nr:DUF262 domain-containing protein [Salegentibacter sp. F188]MDT0688738.1 DUF262 domain-containing protein [Salegentibacter sp. F188]